MHQEQWGHSGRSDHCTCEGLRAVSQWRYHFSRAWRGSSMGRVMGTGLGAYQVTKHGWHGQWAGGRSRDCLFWGVSRMSPAVCPGQPLTSQQKGRS